MRRQLKELDEEGAHRPSCRSTSATLSRRGTEPLVPPCPTQAGASVTELRAALRGVPSLELGMGELFNLKTQIEDVREERQPPCLDAATDRSGSR